MIVRGTEYQEDYTFEMYGGEEVTAILKPLPDEEFLPIAAFLSDHLDVEPDEEAEERADETAVSEAIDKVDDASDGDAEGQPVDVSMLDEEFVAIMQEAAVKGIYGAYDEDGSEVEHTEDEIEWMVDNMMGGYSVEIGSRVLELSGDVRDAEKFRR